MTKEELKQEAEKYASKGGLPKETYLFSAKVIAYLAGAEPREKQIEILSKHILELQADKGRLTDKIRDLEAEVKEWKDKADLWCKTANLKDHNIMINKELEKENAELKCECRRCVYTDCPCILSDYGKDRNGICDHFKDVFDKNVELKEHLKCLIVGMYHIAQHHPTMGAHTKIMQDLREAEQFLNSEVDK